MNLAWSNRYLLDDNERLHIPAHAFVRPGDSIWSIVKREFQGQSLETQSALVDSVVEINNLQNSNLIFPGTILLLPQKANGQCSEIKPPAHVDRLREAIKSFHKNLTLDQKEHAEQISQVLDGLALGFSTASGLGGTIQASNEFSPFKLKELTEVYTEFVQKSNGADFAKKTRARSIYQAKSAQVRNSLKSVNQNFLELTTMEGRKVHQTYRKTNRIIMPDRWATRLEKVGSISKSLKATGTALMVIDLGVTCYQIGKAKSALEKNSSFIQALFTTAVGTGAGLGLAVFLATTPAGWVIIIGAGAAIGAGAFASGKAASSLYEHYFQDFNLIEGSFIDTGCTHFFGN